MTGDPPPHDAPEESRVAEAVDERGDPTPEPSAPNEGLSRDHFQDRWPGDPDFWLSATGGNPRAHVVRPPMRRVAFRRRSGGGRLGLSDLGGAPRRRGRRTRRSRPRRGTHRFGVLRGVLALSAFLTLVLGVVLADAYYQSLKIYRNLEVVVPSLRQASTYLAKGQLPPGDPFRRADEAARRAARQMEHARFTFDLAGAIPLLGRPVHAVRHGVAAAGEVTTAALITQGAVADLMGDAARTRLPVRAADTPVFRGGAVNVKLVQSLTPRLDEVVAHLRAAEREIRAVPAIPLVPRLGEVKRQAAADAARAISMATRARSGARLLPGFLGGTRAKNYLVALENNADLRGPGGGVVAYAIVTAENGNLELIRGGDIRGIRQGRRSSRVFVTLPPELQWYLQNVPHAFSRMNGVNYTPNFPLVAEAWGRMVSKVTGVPIDGVIELDQTAVASILGSRRIRVPAYSKPITGSNLVKVVSHDQYLLPLERQLEFPAQLIVAAWPKIVDPGALQILLRDLGQSLQQKHIQLWSADRNLQEQLSQLGWDGAVRVGAGDYVYVVDNKVVANKVDYYSRLSVRYEASIDRSGTAHSRLGVTLANDSPPGLPRWIAGRGGHSVNRALMLAFVPQRAKVVGTIPEEGLPDHIEAGANVIARTIEAPAGEAAFMRLDYTTPQVVTSIGAHSLYRLVIQHQPLIAPAHLTVVIRLPEGSTVYAAPPGWLIRGNVLTLEVNLTHDLVQEIVF